MSSPQRQAQPTLKPAGRKASTRPPRLPTTLIPGVLSSPVLVPTVLVGLNALYMLLVVFGNTTDYDSNLAFVRHVLAMDSTNFGAPPGTDLDPDVMWRAITTPRLQTVAYLGVIAWEAGTAAVLCTATVVWIRDRQRSTHRARQLSTVGLTMIVVLFAGGFICIGGEWFDMYRSNTWNGLDPAFRNTVMALLTLLLIRVKPHDR